MKKLAVLFALLPVAALAWWALSSDPEVTTTDSTSTPVPAPSQNAASAAVAAPAELIADASTQRTNAPVPEQAAAQGPESILRGRCVDAAGQPIAGVEATLHGWGANQARRAAWTKEHDEPESTTAKTTTGADGVFEFRFWPPPPFQFALDLAREGLGSMTGRWGEIAPGSTKELGDIAMSAGTLLHGRIVDSKGVPVERVQIYVRGSSRGNKEEVAPEDSDNGSTRDASGTFRGRHALLPGTYTLDVRERTIVAPKQLVLDGSVPEQFVEVVVEALDDQKAIRGVVVDELGAPIRGATIDTDQRFAGQRWILSTDRKGEFRLAKPEANAPETVRVRASHRDFDPSSPSEPIAWGRADVRVTLVRRPVLEVLVVADADGEPVEDYQLRVLWPGNSNTFSSSDNEVRGGNHHDGGRLRVTGVSQGRHLVMVEPRDPALAIGVAEFDAPLPTTSPLVVRLPASVRRELRVEFAGGKPAAGVPVQLAELAMLLPSFREGLARGEIPPVMPPDHWAWNCASHPLQLQTGTTDAQGRFVLQGAGNRDYLLRLPGPPNAPVEFADVRMSVAEPLVVTLRAGARLEGTVSPSEAVAEFYRLGGVKPDETDAFAVSVRPSVQLQRADNTSYPPDERPAQVDANGKYVVEGVPAGAWSVLLEWHVATESGYMQALHPVGRVVLEEEGTTRFDIDASFVLPGDLDGRALHNGAALADTQITLVGHYGRDASGQELTQWWPTKTDAAGRFRARVRGGEYRAVWSPRFEPHWSPPAERATVVAGRTTTQDYHFESGSVRVHLLDANGSPAVGVQLELGDTGSDRWVTLPATDADGRMQSDLDTGNYTVRVLPKRLQDPKAQQELWQNRVGNSNPLDSLWLTIGTASVQTGPALELELRLPADW